VSRKSGLGRGLDALIPSGDAGPVEGIRQIGVAELRPNPRQPRREVPRAELEELAQSIRQHGVLQPIVVTPAPDGRGYLLVAGERRLQAARQAGLTAVPAVVRVADERLSLELALVENLQREDLNPIDEALAYQRLADEFGLTQDQIAAAVGKDRTSVANYLRLLRLPEEVRGALASGSLSMGHARALLALPDAAAQRQAARDVIARALSVRDTEALARKLAAPSRPGAAVAAPDVHTRAAEERLRFALGTKVRIIRRRTGGAIEIAFGSEAELNRLYEQLTDTGRSPASE